MRVVDVGGGYGCLLGDVGEFFSSRQNKGQREGEKERSVEQEVDIRARHREARYNASRAHFISYCRELWLHRTTGLDVRTCRASAGEPNGR